MARIWTGLAAAFVLACAWISVGCAGELQRSDLERFFPPPCILGEKDDVLPIWPIFKQNGTADELVAYVFESVDLAPIPGFSGTPLDLLVALAPEGDFLDVKVLSHHEPVFVDGLGPEPLFDFVRQYAGKSLKQSIRVGPPQGGGGGDGAAAVVNGVAKATASVRIVNESLLAAGLAVARAKLGFAEGRDPSRAATLRADVFERLDWASLAARGYVRHYVVTNEESEAPFAGTNAEGLDPEVRARPSDPFIDLWVGALDAPVVGRNLLDDATFARLISDLDGRHALIVISTGRLSFAGDDFVAGATPARLAMRQGGAPVEIRDFAWRKPFILTDMPQGDVSVLTIKALAGWDPASPADFSIRATREKGQILPERISHDFVFPFSVPLDLLALARPESAKGFRAVWLERKADIVILTASLSVLSLSLALQKIVTSSSFRFAIFRRAFLAFTLVFIGWYAQAQLSVVTLIGLARAARGAAGFAFLLYDPPSLLLWTFTLVTMLIWGRGTFCGWLCPFGALQEFVGDFARGLRLPQWRISTAIETRLRGLKYVALALVLGATLASSALADQLAEIEPFKTAITLTFVRSLPFVLYAVGLLAVGLFIYKFFCRYLCPLGAAFALVGLARRWDWIARRVECGDPCQLCRAKCRYNAIEPSGSIIYHECFQCMDCVVIHNDRRQCVPLIRADRRLSPLRQRKAAAL
ncbi:MAG: 4Fe-4S binding protein [Hyphomicrobiales bacterium]|nr:4Fe-4S binding protein [Hyphomicrobiales bacterium]MBV8443229.1 4Fe-4S binding protein [Hyphomicrobiales bacterium]